MPPPAQTAQTPQLPNAAQVVTTRAKNLTSREQDMLRGAGLAAVVTLLLGLGVLLRWLSFATEIEAIASIAAMVLFAPATYVLVYLCWTIKPSLRHVLACLLAFAICFATWNGIMLVGLPAADGLLALQFNLVHWGTFFLGSCISLRFLQWTTGIGIAAKSGPPLVPESLPSRLSVSKLLLITAACGLCAEGLRRSNALSSFSRSVDIPLGDPQLALLTPEDWLNDTTWNFGALGGLFLGIHWAVLVALQRAGSYRTAGVIVWIAIAALVRWYSTAPDWEASMAVSLFDANAPDGVSYEMIVVDQTEELSLETAAVIGVEALIQTGLAWFGIRCFAKWGYPIRFLRRGRPSNR
jgi:hypothetical protein